LLPGVWKGYAGLASGSVYFWLNKKKGRAGWQVPVYIWLRGKDLNLRPSGYEPDELPDCSTPRHSFNSKFITQHLKSCQSVFTLLGKIYWDAIYSGTAMAFFPTFTAKRVAVSCSILFPTRTRYRTPFPGTANSTTRAEKPSFSRLDFKYCASFLSW
jgi:hypothetical protein